MSDWSKEPNQVMDEIAICVAMIWLDASGKLFVTACNNQFFQLTGVAGADTQTFPIPFDALVSNSAPREFREKGCSIGADDGMRKKPRASVVRRCRRAEADDPSQALSNGMEPVVSERFFRYAEVSMSFIYLLKDR